MLGFGKSTSPRRSEIRRNRPDDAGMSVLLRRLRAEGGLYSLAVAAVFCILAMLILVMREDVVRYRPGQWTRHDIVARVDFRHRDEKRLADARQRARQATPRYYRPAEPDTWKLIEQALLALPDRVKGASTLAELPVDLRDVLDAGALAMLQDYAAGIDRDKYQQYVAAYIASLRGDNQPAEKLIVLPDDQRQADLNRTIVIQPANTPIRTETTFSPRMREVLRAKFERLASLSFGVTLHPKIAAITLDLLQPTHELDTQATAQAQNHAAELVPASAGDVIYQANQTIVPAGEIKQEDWLLLRAENEEYLRRLGPARWAQRVGLAGLVLLLTIVAGAYVARYQPRVVRNHARAAAIAVLLLSMLLLAQLAALGSSTIYFFGVAPTILVAMILAIAYDQRFALGMATFHAVLVTLALGGDVSFLLILEAGVVTCCFLMDDLRTRSKLIEVGGATALAMIAAAVAAGFVQFDPMQYIARNCLHVGAAGLGVGFVVLGILPFIEKAFRITTSMTLLELADASQPLLRRLSLEAPGTYNHSLQVATLAEEAAEAIGANSLLCRVAAYYHDIGKINKADYFVENQTDGTNRHINLSPSVSLLIIIGHVKDGIELAREYNLPTSLFPFIQQHHGTTLVEFFYQRACDTCTPDNPTVSDTQYRYPGPKPRSKEIAILMLADAVESACRAMPEPTASRIETLVHEIAMRRLTDGQFDESDLTMRELELIERSLTKTLLGIYHGRIAYPSTAGIGGGSPGAAAASAGTAGSTLPSAKTA